jgi:uncharacterized protein YeaO (DUF488 family)
VQSRLCHRGNATHAFAARSKLGSRMTRNARGTIKLKRAYEEPSAQDGTRILVDRLWPRGLKKQEARINHWFKEIAPSPELRKWFAHDPARWSDFRRRYTAELRRHSEQIEQLRKLARRGTITLVYGARDEEHNDAVVLRDVLENSAQR